jgi:hypothetical protein
MLDGKQYSAQFPDENPAQHQALLVSPKLLHSPKLLQSPKLLATLRALEKELRPHIPRPLETGIDAGDTTA